MRDERSDGMQTRNDLNEAFVHAFLRTCRAPWGAVLAWVLEKWNARNVGMIHGC